MLPVIEATPPGRRALLALVILSAAVGPAVACAAPTASPGLAVGSRRLHDINKSAWLMLLWLIPVIGWILLIYWAAQPGDATANSYGEPPSAGPAAAMVPGQQ